MREALGCVVPNEAPRCYQNAFARGFSNILVTPLLRARQDYEVLQCERKVWDRLRQSLNREF